MTTDVSVPVPSMADVPQYEILESRDSDVLIALVNSRLKDGWQLAGGLAVSHRVNYPLYAQAMSLTPRDAALAQRRKQHQAVPGDVDGNH